MKVENKDRNPIYYKNAEEMDKPLGELMEELIRESVRIRGKLSDIQRSYGWKDRLDFIEGGMTCIIVSMNSTLEEWKNFENKRKTLAP